MKDSFTKPIISGTNALVFLVSMFVVCCAQGQQRQFHFDATGNLIAEIGVFSGMPQILTQPHTQVVTPGERTSFSVIVANTLGLSYQWRFNSTDIAGATSDSILITNSSLADEGLYSVVLVNSSGSVTSAPAALMLDGDVDGLPNSWELANFGSLAQSGSGDFDGDGVSNADEFQDGTDPTDSASTHFRLTVLANGGLVESVPSQLKYTNGQVVTLTATAFAPEIFHGWTGDVIARTNVVTVTMTRNKTVVAHFQPLILVWANLAGGSWHDPTNWEPPVVPTMEDRVFITNSSPTITLNEPGECGLLTMGTTGGGSNPTVSGTGTLTIHTNAVWSFGTMSGSGRTVIAPTATLSINSPPSSVTLNGRTLENGGTVRLTGTSGIVLNSAVITNRPGSFFRVESFEGQFATTFGSGGGVSRFDNPGTFRKTSSGTTTISSAIAFNNQGVVELAGGSLDLFGGGAHSGSFDVPAGRSLILSGGTHTGTPSSTFTGAGNLTVNNGTANLAGVVNLWGAHTFHGGTINLTGAYFCTNNTLTIGGAIVNFNGTGAVTPAVFTLSAGMMSGSNPVRVLNQMTWSGGVMSGSGRTIIPAGATLTINTVGGVSLATRVLDNEGTVLWTGSGGIATTSAVITNRPGALFQVQNAGAFQSGGGVSRFDNAGRFRKTFSGTTAADLTFNNYGSVEIAAGILSLSGGGANAGSFDVPAGRTLVLSGGTHTANASSSLTGAGNLTVKNGTANLAGLVNLGGAHTFEGGTINLTGNYFCTNNTLTVGGGGAIVNFNGTGAVTPAVLTLSAGMLAGSNPVRVLNQMTWSGGVMSGSGRTIIPPGATLTINNLGAVSLNTRTLDNSGTVLWTGGGGIALTSAVITNRASALFHAQSAASLSASGASRFDNAGTFRKTSTATTTVSGLALNNYGTFEIQRGILAANAGYNTFSSALLHCGLAGTTVGTGYGRLQVAGALTLNGGLSVALNNGFQPATNDAFTVVTAGARNGSFASFSYPSSEVTMNVTNTPTSVIVRVVGIPPAPPRLLTPELTASNVNLTWTATSNVTYRLEFNSGLAATNWTALPGDVTATTNTASKSDPLTPSNRVYRVYVVP